MTVPFGWLAISADDAGLSITRTEREHRCANADATEWILPDAAKYSSPHGGRGVLHRHLGDVDWVRGTTVAHTVPSYIQILRIFLPSEGAIMRHTTAAIIGAFFWATALIGGACQDRTSETTPIAEEEAAQMAVESSATKAHMQDHYERVHDLLTAVIADDSAAAKRHSTWLADHEAPENLSAWKPETDKLRAAAKPGASLTDVLALGQVVANIGTACGDCHVAAGHVPVFEKVEMPAASKEPGAKNHMKAHQWAADRMWEGLTGPSDALWNEGVAALAVSPLHDDEILSNASAAPDIVAQAGLVHELGNEGSNATTTAERADVFARFLGNCASCHARVGMAN